VAEKLYVSPCEQSCFEMEMFLISLYGRKDNKTGILCNHTDGGEGNSGWKMSQNQKDHLSKLKKGKPGRSGWKMNQLQKDKLSKSKTGIPSPIKGIKKKPHTEEHKNRVSNKLKGRDMSMQTEKARLVNLGKERTLDYVNNNSKTKYSRYDAACLVKEFFDSGLSCLAFTKSKNIKHSTFNHWLDNKFVLEILKNI
jgi:hypothetical protein